MARAAVSSAQAARSLDALTGLRFLAALHVVFFHAHAAYLPSAPFVVHHWAGRGYLGVGLFFVLSGFVLSYAYPVGAGGVRGGRRAFWIARFSRIYPVYVLSLLVAAPFVFSSGLRAGPALGTTQLLETLIMVPTMTQAWTPATWMLWNPPAWSLSVEACFYVLFPLLAPLCQRLGTRRLVAVMVGCAILASIPPTAFTLVSPALGPDAAVAWGALATYHPLLRLPEFVLGVALGQLFLRHHRSDGAASDHSEVVTASICLVVSLVLVGLLVVDVPWPAEPFGNGLLAPLYAVLVYGLAASRTGVAWLLSRRPLVLLGTASYALYMLHTPVMEWFGALMRRSPWLAERPAEPWLFVCYLTLAIGASLLTYRLVEQPARRVLAQVLGTAVLPIRQMPTVAPSPTSRAAEV